MVVAMVAERAIRAMITDQDAHQETTAAAHQQAHAALATVVTMAAIRAIRANRVITNRTIATVIARHVLWVTQLGAAARRWSAIATFVVQDITAITVVTAMASGTADARNAMRTPMIVRRRLRAVVMRGT